jgi:2-dehydro-3-deoxyphosphogluconate aldolase / (4S)-4-hydroxy-2-oxoglutarate aldolase
MSMTPEQFVRALELHRTSAIVRADSQAVARGAMNAAITGGVRIVEFTLTTPGALDLVAEFAGRDPIEAVDGIDRVVVGAGTVLTVEQARDAVKAGARFLVSPVADTRVIRAATDLGVAMIPGVHTPTEMLRAHEGGAPLLKLFPAPAGGPAYLRSVLAPLPFLKIVPTNGVDASNIAAWIAAGAWAVGLVGPLFVAEDLSAQNWPAIEARAKQLRALAKSA